MALSKSLAPACLQGGLAVGGFVGFEFQLLEDFAGHHADNLGIVNNQTMLHATLRSAKGVVLRPRARSTRGSITGHPLTSEKKHLRQAQPTPSCPPERRAAQCTAGGLRTQRREDCGRQKTASFALRPYELMALAGNGFLNASLRWFWT